MSKKIIQKRIPELLAPAGNKEAFIAAVEAGADAVYIGGEKLNARMGAGNFSLSEMKEAIDFAHKRRVKVYVTVNTLIDDSEMEEALEYCADLCDMGADAVIVQDFGLGYLIKKYLPALPMHLSTQGSIYDLNGAKAAKELGYERVVLARELSLEEIKNVCLGGDIEVEVFCHGALCLCYSGQCQMSRAIGGRSGNRGACAQPCRLIYEMINDGHSMGNRHYLSPADMNTLDYLGKLSDAGVASLKIEGRMKSPEYVAVVTSIYRKYLDEYAVNGYYSVSDDDRTALMQIFNRGFTSAYLSGRDERFMSYDKPKHRGVCVGKVTACERVSRKYDRNIIGTLLTTEIKRNDILEIGNAGAHCTVTLIQGSFPKFKIGDVIGEVYTGDSIYRMVSKEQSDSAAMYYKNKDWHKGKFIRKTPLICDVISNGDGTFKVAMKEKGGTAVTVTAGPFGQADVSMTERISESLNKTGGTPFEIKDVKFHGDFSFKISVAQINDIRREAITKIEESLCETGRTPVTRNYIDEFTEEKKKETPTGKMQMNELGTMELYYYNLQTFLRDCSKNDSLKKEIKKISDTGMKVRVLIPAAQLFQDVNSFIKNETSNSIDDVSAHANLTAEAINGAENINAVLMLYISNITKGKENEIVEKNFDEICEFALGKGIYIGNVNWIKRFSEARVTVYGDYGLNKYNHWTEIALNKLGASSAVDSLETRELKNGNLGNVPIMTSEHSLEGTDLIDRKGAEYKIIKRNFSSQDIISIKSQKTLSECIDEQMKTTTERGEPIRVYI